jgi:excisionase family DNA binding protein
MEDCRTRHPETMDSDILTTSDTARLLGVSVRTAQMLIESGSLTSWKTPGGHRRVYRDDVLALIRRKNPAPAVRSARVVLLASAARHAPLKQQLAELGGITIEAHTSAYAAAASIGSRPPAAIILDLDLEGADQSELLQFLTTRPALAGTAIIGVVADAPLPPATGPGVQITSLQRLAATVRTALRDTRPQVASLPDGSEFPVAANESERLSALERSGLLAAGEEETFAGLAWLAKQSLQAPVALMTLLTSQHQSFRARYGIDITETPRSWAFCNYTILQREPFVVGDLSQDQRFASNPAVTGDLHFRFYAGAPVIDPDGFAVASLCVIDREPRTLAADQEQALRILARLASDEVRLHGVDRPSVRPAHAQP